MNIEGKRYNHTLKSEIKYDIGEHWSAFWKGGTFHTVLEYELYINKGSSQPICYRHPNYDIHETKTINT